MAFAWGALVRWKWHNARNRSRQGSWFLLMQVIFFDMGLPCTEQGSRFLSSTPNAFCTTPSLMTDGISLGKIGQMSKYPEQDLNKSPRKSKEDKKMNRKLKEKRMAETNPRAEQVEVLCTNRYS
jgi:hypothetical protein